MRYEDASQVGSDVQARDDSEHLAGNDFGPATGNLITGAGTVSGSAGADLAAGAHITAIAGAGGTDSEFDASGKLEIAGNYGTLTIDAQGNYTYVRNPGSPEAVTDTFTYTLADAAGASDTANLVVNIGNIPMLQAQGNQTIQTNNGVVVLPAGVELSDVRVVGRNLVVTLPDGSTMVIPDGAVFVPQLVVNGVEVPASNLAALLIGSEPQPAAGDVGPSQLSSGGNFEVPVQPLDPGVPLGDLIPPTELNYIPPEFEDLFPDEVDEEPVAGTASVQLDDDVIPGKGGNPGGVGDDLPNAPDDNIVTTTLPGSGGDGTLQFGLVASGAPAGFTYDLQPDGSLKVIQIQDGNPVVVLTIVVTPGTGAVTITENNPIRHATGGDENNTEFTISYTVTDDDGDVATGTLTINVDDDTPTVSVTAGNDSQVFLITDDADTEGLASDSDVTSANFDGVFSGTSVSPGADGAGSGTTSGYALNITSSVSGLTSHGAAINLYKLANGTIVGSTAGTAPATATDASVVFSVSVTNTGIVTLTQNQQIDHPAETPSGAPFSDQFTSMADGLVTLTRSETIVDKDGDSVTGSATVNIGQNLRFTDDGPTLDGARANSSVTLDETNGAEPVSAGAPIVATSAAAMIVPVGADYGADGQGPAPVYGLSLLGGGSSVASGLATALGDHPITLTLTSSTLITATYQDGGTQTAFTIQMNANGTITVTQFTALEHLVDGPPGPAHDDALSLINGQEQSLVNATVTIQDFDGDTASASAPIGGAIVFKDDGPSIDIAVGSDANILLVTDDDGTEGSGSTTASTTADFSGAFSIGSSSGGGDGTASISDISYSLTTAGGASGLTSHGNAINLYLVGTTVVGAIGSAPADLNDPDIVFTVSVNGDGVVTLTQLQQIDHANEAPGATDAPFNDQSTHMVLDSLIQLHASATITDNDGDTATDNDAVLNIASNLVFRDDGPTIDASLNQGASVHIDESLPGTDGAGETDAVGLGQVTVAISSIVTVTENPVSADQPTTISYALVLGAPGGNGLVNSGLTTSAGDLPIYLYAQLDGSVIGSTALSAGAVNGSNTVFTVALSGGNVVMTQFQAIEHPIGGASHDENTTGLAANALQLQATGTDFDGDTDTDTVDLGSVITFGDDGPAVNVIEGTLPTDPQALAAFQLQTQDHGTEAAGFTTDSTTVNFSGLFSLSKDGGSDGEASSSLTYDLDLLGAGNGPVNSGLASHGQTIWLYQLDANTVIGSTSATVVALGDPSIVFQLVTTNDGAVTQTQFQQIDHVTVDPTPTVAPFDDHIISLGSGLINVVATGTITDNDGDTASDVETIDLGGLVRFQDDGPTADNEGNIATVNDSATNVNIGNVSTLLDGDNYHADGPAASGAITIATGSLGGTITIDGSGNMLYTSHHDTTPGNTDVETFTYTIKDFDGDTASATFTVTLTESAPTITPTSFSVDEEGLLNGIAGTVYLDGSDLAGTSTSASGTLSGFSFGGDGQGATGNIVLAASADTGLRTLSNHVVATVWDGATHTLTGFDDANGDGIKQGGEGTVFTLQIDNVSTGHYQFNLLQPVRHTVTDSEDDKSFSVNVTVTDSDNDPASSTINITIDDDSPQVSNVNGGASVTLDETTAVTPAGFPISASSLTAVITATTAFGADGAAAVGATVYGLSLAGGVTTISSGLATAIGDFPITLNLVDSTHITGTYVNGGTQTAFTITMNSNGTISVQQNVPLEHLVDGSSAAAHDDSLDLVLDGGALTNLVNATITIKDGDGDTHSGSTPIGDQIIFKDDGPTIDVTATNEGDIVLTTQDAQTIGTDTDTDASTANFSSVFNRTFTTGADGAAAPVITYDLSVLSSVSGLSSHGVAINLYELANGVIVGSTALSAPTLETDSSVVFSVAVASDGTVTLKQYQQVDHTVEGTTTSPFDDQFAVLANGKIQLTGSSTITDNDGDTATDSVPVDLGGNIRFADDGPDVSAVLTGTQMRIDETDGVTAAGGEVDPVGGNLGTVTLTAATLYTVTQPHVSADAPTTLGYALTLSSQGVDSGLDVSSNNASILLYNIGGVVYGSTALTQGTVDTVGLTNVAFTVSINAGGDVTLTQYQAIEHPTAPSSYDEDSAAIAAGALNVTITATDFDGDTDSASVDLGSVIRFEDDGPTAFNPQDATLTNAAGSPVAFALDPVINGGDNNIGNNIGSDTPGTVRFPASIDNTDSGFTSGGVKIWYILDATGQHLLGRTGVDAATAEASGTTIFAIDIDQANSQYTVDMNGTIDSFTTVNFDDTLFDFVGGNDAWFGIVPNGQTPGGTPGPQDDESHDLLITPLNETSINTSGILGGVDTGQSVGPGEGFRIDYVIDLTGSPPGGGADYQDGVVNGHILNDEAGDVQDHWTTNGAFLTMRQSTGSNIRIQAFDDTSNNNIVGDGTQDTITQIRISYNGGTSALLTPTNTLQNVTVGGVQFSYQLDVDGKGVLINNVQGNTGANETPATTVTVYTANGYNSLEVEYVSGDTFKFAGFGAVTQSTDPVLIHLPVQIVDADGDIIAATSTIDITLNPAGPPVVLDMNGDGASFVGLNAGVTFNYGNGLVNTAWVDSHDAILVRDANGNGQVDNASELAFGGDGMTDMEALHAQYGEQLDASDADFTMFAVWTDANSNGVVDANELQSLAEAGITSIGLVSDGIGYLGANGDVTVAGTATFTRADGSTGDAADAIFATSSITKSTQEVQRVAANSNSVTLAAAVAAAGVAMSSTAVAAPAFDSGHDALLSNAVVGRESFAAFTGGDDVGSHFSMLGSFSGHSFDFGALSLASTSHTAIMSSHIGELTTQLAAVNLPTALLDATDFSAMTQMPTMAMDVAMPSFQALAAAHGGGVEAQNHTTIQQIVADALHGGGEATDINALLNALPGAGLGENAGLDSLATHGMDHVPTWDTGNAGVFTMDLANIMTNAMNAGHHDAMQPVANG